MAIQVGDIVTLVYASNPGTHGEDYTVEVVKDNSPSGIPYWVLSRAGRTWTFDCPVILRSTD